MAYDDDYAGIEEITREDAMNIAGNRGQVQMNSDSPAIILTSNGNDDDSVIEDQATRSVAGFAKPDKALLSASEIIEEAKEEDEEKKEEREEKREQTVRVVIDKPKPKKKQKFEEGLTDEEKKEYKAMRMDEKRTMLSERKTASGTA